MYTIQIKEVRSGEISFETIEEAKQWYIEKEMFTGITMMKEMQIRKRGR